MLFRSRDARWIVIRGACDETRPERGKETSQERATSRLDWRNRIPRRRLYCYKDIVAFHILPILRHPPNSKFLFKDRARGGGLRQLPSIYFDPVNALESIRFDTCARIEAEQQNSQTERDYHRNYHCTPNLFLRELLCRGAVVGFYDPSFETEA